MTNKVFPSEYAHGTITLTAKFYGHDGSAPVYYTTSDILSLGVGTFNGRTGNVTLASSDITGAGGLAAANPTGTGILTLGSTGAGVALGALTTASTVTQKFRTSGFSNDYDTEWQYSGGTNSVAGQGTVNLVCGTFQVNGVSIAASSNPTPRIVTASGAVQIVSTDGLVIISKAANEATTVTLETSPAANRVPVRIVDGKGDAGVNNITIVPASGTINGGSTFVLNQNHESVTVEAAGGNWFVT